MSLDACAAMVARADPERFRAAMTAPMPLRGDLMALYAFNLEVARAGVVTAEPLIAAMRLQWWRDVLGEVRAGGAVRALAVATPRAAVMRRVALHDAEFDALLTARAADMDPDFPTDLPALLDYLRKVSGGMMQLAVRVA
ncbi:MAG: squalene/phytoene synthase family protein, partial [Pseudomonadota bacterium]